MNPLPSSESSQDTTESKGSSLHEIKKSAAPIVSTYMQSDTSSDDDILGDDFGSLSDAHGFEDDFEDVPEDAREVRGIVSEEEGQNTTETEREKPAEVTEQEAENATVQEAENTIQPLDNILHALRDNAIPTQQENTVQDLQDNTISTVQDITIKDLHDNTLQTQQEDIVQVPQDKINQTLPDNSNPALQDTTENLTEKLKCMIEKYMKTRINYKIRIIDKNFTIFDGILRKIDEFHNLHFEEILKYINPLKIDSYDDVGNSICLDQIQINCEDIMSFEVKEKVHARLPRSCKKKKGSYKRTFDVISTSDSDSDFIPLSTYVSQPKKPNNSSGPKSKNASGRKPNHGSGPSRQSPYGNSSKMD